MVVDPLQGGVAEQKVDWFIGMPWGDVARRTPAERELPAAWHIPAFPASIDSDHMGRRPALGQKPSHIAGTANQGRRSAGPDLCAPAEQVGKRPGSLG